MLTGRQIARMIYNQFEVTATENTVLEFEDFSAMELKFEVLTPPLQK